MDQFRLEVEGVIAAVPLDILQFLGSETEQECSAFKLPWLKAVAMENAGSLKQAERDFPGAAGLLLDSHSKGKRGGTGKLFDWSLSRPVDKPVWLAGGLNPDNVEEAIHAVKPFAVDVSSGVESRPGIKDAAMIDAFFQAVRIAESKFENGKRT